MPIAESVAKKIGDAGGRLRVKSALNPVLWLCGIVTVPLIALGTMIPGGPPPWLLVLASVPVVLASVGFMFLLIFDRDKLQSEDYQIRMRSLSIIESKGGAIPLKVTSLEAISNPDMPQLQRPEAREPGQ